MEGHQMLLPPQCAQDDKSLAVCTVIRYLVIGLFMMYRFWNLSRKAAEVYRSRAAVEQRNSQNMFAGCRPFEQHPKLSTKLATSRWLLTKFIWAGCLFIQSEGVGLAVYFGVSALMDNFTVFFIHGFRFCKCATSVAVYTMSLVSFLPTAAFAKYFQPKWYEGKPWNPIGAERWYQSKLFFVATMVLITVLSFLLRLQFVVALRWDATVNDFLNNVQAIKVPFAICVPPLVDLFQSLILVMSGKSHGHTNEPFLARNSGVPNSASTRSFEIT